MIEINNWKNIWDNDKRVNNLILQSLISADGFDSGAGSFSVDDWIKYVQIFYKELDINTNDTIYEIGCGSGAFLYLLYLQNHQIGGIDYSKALIELTKAIMPKGDFVHSEASNINISQKYDIVISHSVFQYFTNLEYAKDIITKMFNKAQKTVAIFDINDIAKKDEYDKLRMGKMSKDEYEKKYKNLKHLFFSKEWFYDIAKEMNCDIEIFDQDFKSYTNSQLRYNVIIHK